MSKEITISSRIICKHDTEENWRKNNPNFIPEQSEIIVYDIDSTHNYERMKVGDGITKLSLLPFQVSDTELTNRLTQIQDAQKIQVSETKPTFACTWFRINTN